MPRKELMSYEGSPNFRWVKMHKGVRYRVSCEELRCPLHSREATYQAANEWWLKKQRELDGNWHPNSERLVAEMERATGVPIKTDQDATMWFRLLVEQFKQTGQVPGWFAAAHLGTKTSQVDEAVQKIGEQPTPTFAAAIDGFLSLQAGRLKANTFRTLKRCAEEFKSWLVRVDEESIRQAFLRLQARTELATTSKKLYWKYFKQIVGYLAEQGHCELPRNLHSKLFAFKTPAKAVKTWATDEVKAVLASLPDRMRLWAMLGLNCGMTGVDIAALSKDMVAGGYLTRKRVKTEEQANVPLVKYRLWQETLELLERCKSDHPTLWLTTRNGTPLSHAQTLPDGASKHKDIMQQAFQRNKVAIPLKSFRSIAATLIGKDFNHLVGHFLGHAPRSIAEKHYQAIDQQTFDRAIAWLGREMGLEGD